MDESVAGGIIVGHCGFSAGTVKKPQKGRLEAGYRLDTAFVFRNNLECALWYLSEPTASLHDKRWIAVNLTRSYNSLKRTEVA